MLNHVHISAGTNREQKLASSLVWVGLAYLLSPATSRWLFAARSDVLSHQAGQLPWSQRSGKLIGMCDVRFRVLDLSLFPQKPGIFLRPGHIYPSLTHTTPCMQPNPKLETGGVKTSKS